MGEDAGRPVISCVVAPSLDTPAHIELAERLGYRRAWCYDSPALCADPWMMLALAAGRTRVIGLGPATLVPSLRHSVVTAAALATLAGLAPGRVAAAFGTGLTGRLLLGERPLRWAEVEEYVAVVRALLRGEDAAGPRAIAAAGPALAAAYHAFYESKGADGVDTLPGGREWRAAVEAVEPSRRHQAIHDGHLIALGEHDQALLARAAPLLTTWTLTGTGADIGARLRALSSAGITEIAYQPMGPDIPRELTAFARAAGITAVDAGPNGTVGTVAAGAEGA